MEGTEGVEEEGEWGVGDGVGVWEGEQEEVGREVCGFGGWEERVGDLAERGVSG